jgi:hypothetical protein
MNSYVSPEPDLASSGDPTESYVSVAQRASSDAFHFADVVKNF